MDNNNMFNDNNNSLNNNNNNDEMFSTLLNNKFDDQKPKKSKKNFKIIVIILFVVGLLIGVFFGVNYFLNSNKSEKTESDKKETKKETEIVKKEEEMEISISDPTALALFNRLNKTKIQICGVNEFYKGKKLTVNDLPNKYIYYVAINLIKDDLRANGNSDPLSHVGEVISSDTLRNAVDRVFGKSYHYVDGDDIGTCMKFTYNPNNKYYVLTENTGCGGICREDNAEKVVKITKTSTTYNVYVRFVYSGEDNDGRIIYFKDYAHTKQITNYEKDSNGNYAVTDNNMAQGSLYKFSFTKEDNNYIFAFSDVVE